MPIYDYAIKKNGVDSEKYVGATIDLQTGAILQTVHPTTTNQSGSSFAMQENFVPVGVVFMDIESLETGAIVV